jgi:NAD(P)-dependent dehydrogenase (short-subunit alcohol dehydrogenase family)
MASSQVVMITGASAGVGRATARAFARAGATVGLLARGRVGLDAAGREVEALGGHAALFEADVADAAAVRAAADALAAAFGRIDVWVNNAMVSVFSPVAEMTPEDYKRVTDVTYLGVVHGTLAALHHMRPRNAGVIVQVGSALAYRGIPLQSAYCAAKHAVKGFCDSLRTELTHDRCAVQVTMVQLPAVNTPQFEWVKSRLPQRPRPVPPILQPEVVAEAIVAAARDVQREVFVGYPTVVAIVGNKLAPGLADWYLSRYGYASQQTSEPEDPNRPHNLWQPLDATRDFGAHGRFDQDARRSSWQLWAARHRPVVTGALVAIGGLCGAALLGPWRRN